MVLFNLLTCLTEQICQNEMFTLFCLSICMMKRFVNEAFVSLRGTTEMNTFVTDLKLYI